MIGKGTDVDLTITYGATHDKTGTDVVSRLPHEAVGVG